MKRRWNGACPTRPWVSLLNPPGSWGALVPLATRIGHQALPKHVRIAGWKTGQFRWIHQEETLQGATDQALAKMK
jgi:hypothetical protein